MKYTKKEVIAMFARLVKAMDRHDKSGNGLGLDYNAIYGGYVIVKHGEIGSESHPFGCIRRTAKEMYLSMYMAAQTLEDIKNKQELLSDYEG